MIDVAEATGTGSNDAKLGGLLGGPGASDRRQQRGGVPACANGLWPLPIPARHSPRLFCQLPGLFRSSDEAGRLLAETFSEPGDCRRRREGL